MALLFAATFYIGALAFYYSVGTWGLTSSSTGYLIADDLVAFKITANVTTPTADAAIYILALGSSM